MDIITAPNPILNSTSSIIEDPTDPTIKELAHEMARIMYETNGCGLAAPQIGVSLRVLIVDGDVMTDVYDYLAGFKRVMINPVILESSNHGCEYSEGCLSVPGIYADVTLRFENGLVRCFLNGRIFDEAAYTAEFSHRSQ